MKTLRELTTTARRLDRFNGRVAAVLEELRDGAALRLEYRSGAATWFLSTGNSISADVARAVIRHPEIAAVDAGLFAGTLVQTWLHAGMQPQTPHQKEC
jgi:hypothetical protein